jgi:hypothetical protein
MARLAKSITNATTATDRLTATTRLADFEMDAAKDAQVAQKKYLDELNKQYKAGKLTNEQYQASLRQAEKQAADLSATMGDLDDEVNKEIRTTIAQGKAEAEKHAEKLRQYDQLKKTYLGMNGAALASKAGFASLAKLGSAAAGLVKQIQDGASGTATASAALTTGIDLAGGAAKSASGAISSVGGAMKGGWGVALSAGGAALGMFSTALSETAKLAIAVLTKEIDKQIASYHTMAAGGALFADGMTEMMAVTGEAQLSMKTMSGIVKGNSEALYRSGVSIADATKKIGKTFSAGGDQFKTSLINLGFSIEEQGGLISETMANLKLAGADIRKLSGGDIAESTRKYAVSLKTIAAITGEDAKKKMEAAREAMANAAVQAKLANMSVDERKKFQEGLSTVPESLKNAVMQQKLLGVITDKNANILMATVPGIAENIRGMSDHLQDGSEAVGVFREKMAQNIADANKEGGVTEALGRVAIVGVAGAANDASTALTQLTLSLQKGANTPGASKEAADAANKMANTTDATTQEFAKLQIQGEKLTSILEQSVNVHLAEYGRLLALTNEQMINSLGKLPEAIDAVKNAGKGNAYTSAGTEVGTKLTSKAIISSGTAMAEKVATKAGASAIAKVGAASVAKLIPGVGLAVGGYFAKERYDKGDNLGAAGELAAGVASLIPVFGTMVSATITGGLIARDLYNATQENTKAIEKNKDGTTVPTEGHAAGGIASGPMTGYMSLLHGSELVLPLTSDGQVDQTSKGYSDLLARVSPQQSKTAGNSLAAPKSMPFTAMPVGKQDVSGSIELDATKFDSSISKLDKFVTQLSDTKLTSSALDKLLLSSSTSGPMSSLTEYQPVDNTSAILSSALSDISASVKAQQASSESALDAMQKLLANMETPSDNKVMSEVKQSDFSQQIVTALVKMNELLQAQSDKTDEYLQLTKEMVNIAADHKNISTKMYRAT